MGLFGWERVRGTFLEPHFLGAFLAALFPVSVLVAWRSAGRRRVVWAAGVAAAAMGMLVAVSVPAYGALSVGIATAAALFPIGRGWHGPASVISAIAVVVCVAAPVIASSPRTLSAVTGRTESQLVRSSGVRSRAWSGAVRVWSGRPVLGFGPGQSSVQLARQQIAGSSDSAPVVLSSAQGLWAASLIDAGVLGFGAWALFLAGVLVIGARQLVRRPSPLLLAVFAATVSVAVSSELAGDRLETTAWVLFAALLATAASSGQARGRPQQPREQAGRSSNQGAGDRPRAVGSAYRPGG